MPPGGDDVRRRRNGNRIMVLEWGNPRFTRSRREEGKKEGRKEEIGETNTPTQRRYNKSCAKKETD